MSWPQCRLSLRPWCGLLSRHKKGVPFGTPFIWAFAHITFVSTLFSILFLLMPGNVPANVELRGICIDSHIAEHHKRIFLAATRHYPLFSVFSRQNRTFFPTVFVIEPYRLVWRKLLPRLPRNGRQTEHNHQCEQRRSRDITIPLPAGAGRGWRKVEHNRHTVFNRIILSWGFGDVSFAF